MTTNDKFQRGFLEQRAYSEINKVLNGDKSGSLDLAIRLLTDCIKEDDSNPWIYNNRGFAYHIGGEPFLAIADVKKAIDIDPEIPFFQDNLYHLQDLYNQH